MAMMFEPKTSYKLHKPFTIKPILVALEELVVNNDGVKGSREEKDGGYRGLFNK